MRKMTTEEQSCESLKAPAANVVLPYHTYSEWSFIENANLISKDDLDKLFADNALLEECCDIYPLKYLTLCEPKKGVFYAAKHGIFILYKLAKKYLKEQSPSDYIQTIRKLCHDIINTAVTGGDIDIIKDIYEKRSSNIINIYKKAVLQSKSHIIDYCIENGGCTYQLVFRFMMLHNEKLFRSMFDKHTMTYGYNQELTDNLFECAVYNGKNVAIYLIDNMIDIGKLDLDNLLSTVAYDCGDEVLKYLINKGARPDEDVVINVINGVDGHYYCRYYSKSTFIYMMETADCSRVNMNNVIQRLVGRGGYFTKYLIERYCHCIDLNALLLTAATAGSWSYTIVKYLIHKGATSLEEAFRKAAGTRLNQKMVIYFIEKCGARDFSGALSEAIPISYFEPYMTRSILEKGAPYLNTNDYYNAIFMRKFTIAFEKKNEQCVCKTISLPTDISETCMKSDGSLDTDVLESIVNDGRNVDVLFKYSLNIHDEGSIKYLLKHMDYIKAVKHALISHYTTRDILTVVLDYGKNSLTPNDMASFIMDYDFITCDL
jgi:hypothetical protein